MISANKLAYFRARIFGEHRPITADVFLTDYCNNKCPYCRYAHKTGGFMSFELFKQIYGRLKELGVKGIILTGGGEPTINPDFDNIAAFLESEQFPYGVNTNFNVYKDCCPVFLKISIDAGTREAYKRLRGADAFERVLENIYRYAGEYGKGHGMPWRTRLGVQCVVGSLEQAQAFYRGVKRLPVDYIQFRPIERRNGVKSEEYTKVLEWLAGLPDYRISRSYKFDHVGTAFDRCDAHWSAICVDHTGQVLYCCHRPDAIMGSVFDRDILQKCAEYRPDMSKCDIPCRLTGANIAMREIRPDYELFFV